MINWLTSWRGIGDITWLSFLLVLLWHFAREWCVLQQTKHWLIAKGRITQLIWTHERHHLWPKIEYTYQVYERDFVGEYFFLDTTHNNPYSAYARKVAYRAAIAFEKDEDIDVFYNPNNPLQAALDVTIPAKLTVIICLLLGLIAIHLMMIVHHLL